jgi:DNA invertase Pin-like site-specific DNA recombinase
VKRAILLARVSTTKDTQESSLDRQLITLRATAAARGWKVVLELLVDESGRDVLGRDDVRTAVDWIVRKRADVLAFDHLFRLGRNTKELLEVLDLVEAAGGGLYEQEREIDGTGPLSRFVFTIFAAAGEFWRRDNSRKIREGLEHARRKGRKLGRRRTVDYSKLPRVRELRAAGVSWRKIAGELGGSHGAWSAAVRRAG